jgi:excisionase family DNA binding protein
VSTIEAERAYRITEAAAVKGVSEATIRRAIHASDLKAKKVGRFYSIPARALDDWYDALPEAT